MKTDILRWLASQTCAETGSSAQYAQSIFKHTLNQYQLQKLVNKESYAAVIYVRPTGEKTSRQKVAGLRRSLGL